VEREQEVRELVKRLEQWEKDGRGRWL